MEVYVDGVLQGGGGGSGDATSIQGIPVSATPPLLNQVLQYDGSQWVPTSVSTPWIAAVTGSAITTDATPTTCGSYTPAAGSYTLEAWVSGQDNVNDVGVSWQLICHVTSDGSTATIDGSTITSSPTTPLTTWNAAFDTSTSDVIVQVTGDVGVNIDWVSNWIVR